jgi:hypothetical protein
MNHPEYRLMFRNDFSRFSGKPGAASHLNQCVVIDGDEPRPRLDLENDGHGMESSAAKR